jgi:hypothetical protein
VGAGKQASLALEAERREWDRLPISIPFFVRGRNGSVQESLEFATALNVSGGGVLREMRGYIEPGTGLSLELSGANSRHSPSFA